VGQIPERRDSGRDADRQDAGPTHGAESITIPSISCEGQIRMPIRNPIITIVGCGPGSLDYVTPAALKAIEEADVLVSAKRLLDLFLSGGAERISVDSAHQEALEAIEARKDRCSVVVLVTGDPGLYSLARLVIKRFGREHCRVVPGISSVQTAFARLCLDWHDARVISTHKEDPDPDPSLQNADKIAVLVGREGSIRWVADHLLKGQSEDRRVFVCENLTLEDERIREVEAGDLPLLDVSPQTVIVIVKRSLLL